MGDYLEENAYYDSSPSSSSFPNSTWNLTTAIDNQTINVLIPVPLTRQIFWSLIFTSMVIVAALGNAIVIWIVLAHKRMRTVTNYLLVNLSIADLMVSTINVLPNFIYMLWGHWPFGTLYCKVVQFVAVLSICASVFSLMCIAFDRYSAIMNPLRPRMGKRLTLGIAGITWVVGSIIGAPHLVFSTTITYQSEGDGGENQVLCYAEWPDGPQTESRQEFWYNIIFMIFTYFIPILAMSFTYFRVGVELWGSKSIGECTQRQLDNIKSKRRVVKMMITVVIIFAICWLPFQCYFIWVSLFPEITQEYFVREVFLAIYWLAMSNSMYNPIIYCWMNARFRRGFQQVFRFCPFIHYDEMEGNLCGGTSLNPEINRMRFIRPENTTRYTVTGNGNDRSPETDYNNGAGNNRINSNGTTVHIPLHVLTTEGGRTTTNKYLAPPVKTKHKHGKNFCNSEFM